MIYFHSVDQLHKSFLTLCKGVTEYHQKNVIGVFEPAMSKPLQTEVIYFQVKMSSYSSIDQRLHQIFAR